jgi:hypothetical protein
MNGHIGRFWYSTLLAAAICGGALHLWWAPKWQAMPHAPFPFSRTSFLDEYSDRGIASHYLYWSGIFGFGQRMQQSDVILVGTSHVWFGLSAERLGEQLSAAEGRTVHVMNMGLGYADEAFQFQVLQRHHFAGKTIITDLYCPGAETISPWAMDVKKCDWIVSYVRVLELWADGLHDWCLDSLFPRFQAGTKPIYGRFFAGCITCRWDTDDTDYIWMPTTGYYYHRGTPPLPSARLPYSPQAGTTEARFWGDGSRGIGYPDIAKQVVADNHLRSILVMMPFYSYRLDLARQAAAENHLPLVEIPLDGLRFSDWGHINAPSRDIATKHLGDEIIRRDLLTVPNAR